MISSSKYYYLALTGIFTLSFSNTQAQYPATCAGVGFRANSNGQTNNCPHVNGTAYAANFAGTVYATVPVTAKTGNLQLVYSGHQTTLKPFAIAKVWQTNPTTVLLPVSFGPAGVPTISGANTVVDYCFYGTNLPNIGVLSLLLVNPETKATVSICSYDASGTSNCTVVVNPVATTLPVTFAYTNARKKDAGVYIEWATATEVNNKGFTIERSIDAASFTAVAFVPPVSSNGNSNQLSQYSYTDNKLPAAQHLVYRIKQTDNDGQVAYSPIMSVVTNYQQPELKVSVAAAAITVAIHDINTGRQYKVMLYDTQGRLVQYKQASSAVATVINGIQAGALYYVVAQAADGSIKLSQKILKTD